MSYQTSNKIASKEMINLHDKRVADMVAGAFKQVL
jgi:hypothetical protein